MARKAHYRAGMNAFEYCVSLWVEHPTIDPDHISRTLGIQPQTSHRVGERRRTPNGRLLQGNYTSSYWNAQLELRDGEEIAKSLESIVSLLRPHKSFFQRLRDEGALIQLFWGFFATGLCDYELPYELIGEVADLRIGLRFDYYGPPREAASRE